MGVFLIQKYNHMPNPIKPTLKSEIIPLIMIAVSAALSFYFYAHWPMRIASHWNFRGEVDGYASSLFMALFFPLLLIGLYLLFLVLPYIDPRREHYVEFAKTYHVFKGVLLAALLAVYLVTGIYNLGYDFNVGIAVAAIIGVLMIVIGSFLSKIKFNYFMGIRTPWTLASETVWDKTHRVGGWLFVLLGCCIIVAPFLPEILALIVFITGAAIAVIGSFLYSYLVFRQEKKK